METKVLVFRNWNDLVFFNRNQDYGAYPIRQAYSRRLILAFGVSTAVMATILLSPRVLSSFSGEIVVPRTDTGKKGTIKVWQPPVIPQHPKPNQFVATTSTPNRSMQVVRDLVTEQVPLAETPTFTGSETDSGTEGVEGIPDGVGDAPVEVPAVAVAPPWVVIAEVMPVYSGGMEAMMKFIRKNIKYPATPRRLGIDGTVFVSFVVHGDGSISHVSVLRGIHPHCDAEAMRVIGMLPGWIGGKQGGNPVAVKMVLPIKFNLEN
jgi:protein TonB